MCNALAHLLLTQIVTFYHCFGNAAYNTSQVQAAVVQVIKPHQVFVVDVCDPKRVMVMDGIFSAWGAWHVLLKYHLRPASQRAAVHTVLRRLWLLRIMTMSHIPEKPSYWRYYLSPRGHLQVSGSPFEQEKVLAFTLSPPKYVSHRIVEESLPHQQIVFWSEWAIPLMLLVEKALSVDSTPSLKTFTFLPPTTYLWGTASSLPSLLLKPKGNSHFISK